MIRKFTEQRWSIFFGLVIGTALSFSAFGTDSLWKLYDEVFPVVEMRGEIVDRTDDAVFIRVSGEKHRSCRYANLQTFGVDSRGEMHFVSAQYVGLATKGTLPRGNFDLGTWRLWPTTGAVAVRMYASHDCNGRLVTTQIAEVAL